MNGPTTPIVAPSPPMTTTATLAGLLERVEHALQLPYTGGTVPWIRLSVADTQELLARIAALTEALEPFAREGRQLVEQQDPYSWCNTGLSNANLRRAALTLKENDCGQG